MLKLASEKLLSATERLQQSNTISQQFFDQVLEIRKNFRLMGPMQPTILARDAYDLSFKVDYSYRHGKDLFQVIRFSFEFRGISLPLSIQAA